MAENKPYVIGLDLGGTNSVFGIVNQDAKIVASVSVKTGNEPNAEDYVNRALESLNKIIDEVGGIDKIKGMGIGAPNGNYLNGCIEDAANLPWKGQVPLAKLFSDKLGIPVFMTNDANAAAMGEMKYGVAKGMQNFIMITLGTGVGSGIVCNGQMVYGCDGQAGELGHMVVQKYKGRECGCGRKGCLETYCSATGVARSAKEVIETSDKETSLRQIPVEKITSYDVFKAAMDGDKIAQTIFEFTGRMLGEACANMACFNSPEAFIFFGGLTKSGEMLMKPIRDAYNENVLRNYRNKAKFLISALDDASAAVLGASALAW